jgi:prenyl protein peptidase
MHSWSSLLPPSSPTIVNTPQSSIFTVNNHMIHYRSVFLTSSFRRSHSVDIYHHRCPPFGISTFNAKRLLTFPQTGYTLLYVLPLHLSKAARITPQVSRNDDNLIKARIRAVTISCLLDTVLSFYILISVADQGLSEALRSLGMFPIDPLAVIKTVGLCSVLFIGPLFEDGIAKGNWSSWIKLEGASDTLSSWTGRRTLIAGPISEELVFRSFIIPLHILAGVSSSRIVFLTPLYFGIAHIHHLYEHFCAYPNGPVLPAIVRTVFQFTYTSLFGFFAAFVFLRTGSLYAAIAAHIFCNWQGMPRLAGRVHGGIYGYEASHEDGSVQVRYKAKMLPVWYSVVYYMLLLAGSYGFYSLLWILTESDMALTSFG